jgi:hypothetical protein
MFRSHPNNFTDDQFKITYTISWLKGTALHWYEPNLVLDKDDLPDYTLYWGAFEEALKATFGKPDPVTLATINLNNLSMKDHHHIARYNVKFNEYAALLGYNDHALYTRYYRGLVPHLKDALIYSGKPTTLNGLQTRAQALDLCYWERKDKDCPQGGSSGSSNARPSLGTSVATSSSHSSKGQSTHFRPLSRPAAHANPKKPDIAKVLGPDRKLLPEEKECCRKNNLFLICTSMDHFSDKCPSHKDNSKACAATLEAIDEGDQSEGSASEAESSEYPN